VLLVLSLSNTHALRILDLPHSGPRLLTINHQHLPLNAVHDSLRVQMESLGSQYKGPLKKTLLKTAHEVSIGRQHNEAFPMRLVGSIMTDEGGSIVVQADGLSLSIVFVLATVEKAILEVQKSGANVLHNK